MINYDENKEKSIYLIKYIIVTKIMFNSFSKNWITKVIKKFIPLSMCSKEYMTNKLIQL
jgi:hypothetical protein